MPTPPGRRRGSMNAYTHDRWSVVSATAMMLLATAIGVAAGGAQAPPPKPDRPIAIKGGLLVDATGAPPRHDQTVVIEGERIIAVGPMEQVKVPDGAEVIDATRHDDHARADQLQPAHPAQPALSGADRKPSAGEHQGAVGAQLGAAAAPRVGVPDAGHHQPAQDERPGQADPAGEAARSTAARSRARASSSAARSS